MSKQKAPQDETKEEKFERLVNFRVSRVLNDMDAIGKLSAPNYGYSDEDIEKVKETLQTELDNTMSLFRSKENTGKKTFKL